VEADVDLASTFSGMPGAGPLAGLSEAWHWAMAPGLDFGVALSADGEHVLQCFALRSYDEGLVTAVLSFAREHADVLVAPPERPLVMAEGFAHPGYRFDTVVAFGPGLHRHHADTPEVHQAIRAVQPAFRCEFAGDEREEDATFLVNRASGVPSTELDHEPHPFLKMRYKTDTRVIPERIFTSLRSLVNELRALEDRPDRFVEFENYRHEVRRVEWVDGQWDFTGDAAEPRGMGIDDLLDVVRATLYGPNLEAGTSGFPA
jgi:hypothetical protein